MKKNKATSIEKKATLEAIKQEFKGTDCPTQRTRLVMALKRLGSVSTYEARRYLDIYYPPARIKELRDEGYAIRTHWLVIDTETGDEHRIGLYVLESEVVHEPA